VVLNRVLIASSILFTGIVAGYVLKTVTTPKDQDVEIRAGHRVFTNPLLDCEVATYRTGRELSPFRTDLERRVTGILAAREAEVISLYFRDLDNGPWYGINEDQLFTPGSLLKVPTIIACLKQAELDPAFLRKGIRYEGLPDKEGIGAFPTEVTLQKGRTYTVGELIEHVAAYSDNYAVALLDAVVDRGVLTRIFRDLGFEPQLVAEPLQRALISTNNYGHLFRVLYNASYLNQEMSEKALEYFSRSTYRDGLVAGVPPGTVVSHKFGVFTESVAGRPVVQLHDCGIVYHPRRPYFLCIMTRGGDEASQAAVISSLSRFVYERIDQPDPELVGGGVP